MPKSKLPVYVERGSKRTFASAVDWPGWARAGRTADDAEAALVTYGERYRRAIAGADDGLHIPSSTDDLEVVENVEGNQTTDFGAPGAIADLDRRPVADEELERLISVLRACWSAFERATSAAEGKSLRPGPRGGGRDLAKIRDHVAGAEAAYAQGLGAERPRGGDWQEIRDRFVEGLWRRAHGELPDRGPRGGERWPARYAVRRSAWHALDHAWEIEDRLGD